MYHEAQGGELPVAQPVWSFWGVLPRGNANAQVQAQVGHWVLEFTRAAEGEEVPQGNLQAADFRLFQSGFLEHGLHGGGLLQIAFPLLCPGDGLLHPGGQEGLQPLGGRAQDGHQPVQVPVKCGKHLHQLQLVALGHGQAADLPGQGGVFPLGGGQVQGNAIDSADAKWAVSQEPSAF